MSRLRTLVALSAVALWWQSAPADAHCEIPCGIYGDDLRFSMIMEDIETIEKSMTKIAELSAEMSDLNQLARWVNNKEHHADHIREIVTQYFMTQRVKLPDESDAAAVEAYRSKLAMLHKMLVYAMKCKQTTDLAHARTLHDVTHEFKAAYTK
ncbi:superoxide dismutase [Ni] [Candidatus Latescibacterota bacterium]